MVRDAADSAYADLHKDAEFHDGTFTRWSSKRTPEFPYRFNEGVKVRVARENLKPWDEFATKRDASPLPPAADEEQDGSGDGAGEQQEEADLNR